MLRGSTSAASLVFLLKVAPRSPLHHHIWFQSPRGMFFLDVLFLFIVIIHIWGPGMFFFFFLHMTKASESDLGSETWKETYSFINSCGLDANAKRNLLPDYPAMLVLNSGQVGACRINCVCVSHRWCCAYANYFRIEMLWIAWVCLFNLFKPDLQLFHVRFFKTWNHTRLKSC